jgi:hypothetical protein
MTKSRIAKTARAGCALGFGAWVLGLAAACGAAPLLQNTSGSPDELAHAVLDALARRDRSTLERLVLSEQEFREHVWPQLPASRPERNLPFSYVWGDLRQKSSAGLTKILAEHGGRRYELSRLEFHAATDYSTFQVHREAAFHVRDAQRSEKLVRVCGSMIEKDGAWKVFSYVVD